MIGTKKENDHKGTSSNTHEHYIKILKNVNPDTHCYKALNHLIRYGKLTSMEAFQAYHMTRLSAIVYDLRNKYGVDVRGRNKTIKQGKRVINFSEYYLGGYDG